jgi:hypothetical protein
MQAQVTRSELHWAASDRRIDVRPSWNDVAPGRLLGEMGLFSRRLEQPQRRWPER